MRLKRHYLESGDDILSPTDEINARLKRKNTILFSKNSGYLQDIFSLIEQQTDKTLILWALELAAESAIVLNQKYPDEKRPLNAVKASRDWAEGKIKMPAAQRMILDCHAFAKDISDKADIALCHAVGQACGVVHTRGHAPGYPIYELTSIVYRYGAESCTDYLEKRKHEYFEKLFYWADRSDSPEYNWADFVLKRH